MTELTLPLPPNRGNARGHHMAQHRDKKRYVGKCFIPIYLAFKPLPATGAKYQRVIVSADFYLWNLCDLDNLTARLKWPLDALVKYGVIPDDRPANVQLGSIAQTIDRNKQRLVLRVEEV